MTPTYPSIQELMNNQAQTATLPNITALLNQFPTKASFIAGLIFVLVMLVLMIWSLVIKGIALWRAARDGHKGWFLFIFLIHFFWLFQVIYLLTQSKKT